MVIKDILVFLTGLVLVFLFSFSNYPFGIFFTDSLPVIGIFRIFFGFLLLVKIIRSKDALPLILTNSVFRKHTSIIGFTFNFLLLCCFFLIVGFCTEYVSIIILLIFIGVFLKSKYYSIENIYLQNTLFHLPFLACNTTYSIDSFFGINSHLSSSYMFNSFFISNGLIMFSAGFEKLKSEMWLKGNGACMFVTLPHLVKEKFQFLSNFRSFFKLSGYLIIAAEFLLLLSALNKFSLIFILIVLILFSITLFVIVDISFIGQILLLTFLLFAGTLIYNWPSFEVSDLSLDFKISGLIVFLINLVTLIVISFYEISKKFKLDFLQKFITGINTPIGVFNEKHLFGFYTYRLSYLEENSSPVYVLSAFDKNGFPGKYQHFYPRYFQSAMYHVTDFCLGQLKYGIQTEFKKSEMVDLMYAGLKTLNKSEGLIRLEVKKFDCDETIVSYVSQKWRGVIECDFSTDKIRFKTIGEPPEMKKTFRKV